MELILDPVSILEDDEVHFTHMTEEELESFDFGCRYDNYNYLYYEYDREDMPYVYALVNERVKIEILHKKEKLIDMAARENLDVELLKKENWSLQQMQVLYIAMEKKCTKEQMKKFAKIEFNSNQMFSIMNALRNITSPEMLHYVDLICDKRYYWQEMDEMLAWIYHKLPLEDFENLIKIKKEIGKNYNYNVNSWDAMREYRLGFEHGLSREQIDFYSNSKFLINSELMREIRLGFEHQLPIEYINCYANEYLSGDVLEYLRLRLELDYLTPEYIKYIFIAPEFKHCYMHVTYEEDGILGYIKFNGNIYDYDGLIASNYIQDQRYFNIRKKIQIESREEQAYAKFEHNILKHRNNLYSYLEETCLNNTKLKKYYWIYHQ